MNTHMCTMPVSMGRPIEVSLQYCKHHKKTLNISKLFQRLLFSAVYVNVITPCCDGSVYKCLASEAQLSFSYDLFLLFL